MRTQVLALLAATRKRRELVSRALALRQNRERRSGQEEPLQRVSRRDPHLHHQSPPEPEASPSLRALACAWPPEPAVEAAAALTATMTANGLEERAEFAYGLSQTPPSNPQEAPGVTTPVPVPIAGPSNRPLTPYVKLKEASARLVGEGQERILLCHAGTNARVRAPVLEEEHSK